jgi:hypothetical protein
MPELTNVNRFTVPLGGQEIVLDELVHDAGGMKLLRIRIRERARFTIFDVDPLTAKAWGEAMVRWSEAQADGAAPAGDRDGR